MSEVYVSLEFTPNPNTLKYTVNVTLMDRGGMTLNTPAVAEAKSPLAAKLFQIPGIASVMIGKDFLTITKSEDGDWDVVHQSASKTIQEHLSAKLPVINPNASEGNTHGGGSTALELKIREVLDNEVRPAVARDGGDITFEKFEDGVVYLQMQGSCSGCPSSTMTLKMGIERRLQELIPEVKEVVSV